MADKEKEKPAADKPKTRPPTVPEQVRWLVGAVKNLRNGVTSFPDLPDHLPAD